MRYLGFVALALATVTSVTASIAADMRPVHKVAPFVAAPLWTGFYVGGHAGYGFGNQKWFDNFPVPDGLLDADANLRGWLGGLQAGANLQFGRLVVGLEADFSWSRVRSEFSCFPFGDQVCTGESEWFGTVTGRTGVVFGPSLFYVKGGAAWTREKITDLATCSGSQPCFAAGIPARPGVEFTGYQNRFGWTAGFGVEYLLANNWSLKAEYNYMDFGRRSITLNALDGDFFTEEVDHRVSLVKVGFNYLFTPTPEALSAYGSAAANSYKGPVLSNAAEPPGTGYAFAGADVSKQSYVGWGGIIIAPGNIDTSGPRVFILGSGGRYRYDDVRGIFAHGEALGGYGFEGNNYTVNLLAGVNAENHQLSKLDPTNSVVGTEFGVKLRGDAWVNPTPATLAYVEGDYSTAFQSWSVAGKLGHDIGLGGAFLGPEAAYFGNERFEQWRVGVHLTRMRKGRFEAGVAAGYADDSVVGTGAYGRVDFSYKF